MIDYEFIKLPDGRRLSYLEFGKRTGHPVFFFHGTPSSCLEALLAGNQVFIDYNIRLIAPNRPGMAQSDFQNDRGFSDWPEDVLALADHLYLEKFSVLGNSGGGGYVTACAAKIPERLVSAVVTAGAWQMNLPIAKRHSRIPFTTFWTIAAKLPASLPGLLTVMKVILKMPKKKALMRLQTWMPSADIAALIKGNRMEVLSGAMIEGAINTKGAAHDIQLYVHHRDFSLKEVSFPITFFHGREDKNISFQLVEKMVSSIPNGRVVFFENEAHFSVLCNRFHEVAQALLG